MLYHSLNRTHLDARFHFGFAGAGFPSRLGAGIAGGATAFFSSCDGGVAHCMSSFSLDGGPCGSCFGESVTEDGGSDTVYTSSDTPRSASLYAVLSSISLCDTGNLEYGGAEKGTSIETG